MFKGELLLCVSGSSCCSTRHIHGALKAMAFLLGMTCSTPNMLHGPQPRVQVGGLFVSAKTSGCLWADPRSEHQMLAYPRTLLLNHHMPPTRGRPRLLHVTAPIEGLGGPRSVPSPALPSNPSGVRTRSLRIYHSIPPPPQCHPSTSLHVTTPQPRGPCVTRVGPAPTTLWLGGARS